MISGAPGRAYMPELVFFRTSTAGFSDSRGLTNVFSMSSNFAVAHGAVPTLLAELGSSVVRVDASSLEAYQLLPHAMHSN